MTTRVPDPSVSGPPSPVSAAVEVARFLDELKIPYVIIGGLAVQFWGEPRATGDVDMTVLVPGGGEEEFLQQCVQRFSPRLSDAVAFALRHRVLLVTASNGCPVDIALGLPGYEAEVMKRARTTVLEGYLVRVIAPEDLIIHKCVAGRPRDIEDVRAILMRHGQLDLPYIRRWLDEFTLVLPERDPRGAFEAALRQVRRPRRRDR